MNDLNYRRKQEFIKELGPKLVNLLRENVHENSWSDNSEIIARIAASMKHKETQKRSGFSIQKKIEKIKERNILAVSSTVQNLVSSYLNVPVRSPERQRILSAFATDFTLKNINELCFKCEKGSYVISAHLHQHAKEHARLYGAGVSIPVVDKDIRNRLDDDNAEINFAVTTILGFSDNYAFGVKSITKDDGTTVEIPLLTLTKSADELLVIYRKGIREDDTGLKGMKDGKFKELATTICGGYEKNLAALDSVYVKCCLENFKRVRRLIEEITHDRLEYQKYLLDKTTGLEMFLRRQFPGHLTETTPCSSHSYEYAFGECEEIANESDLHCKECDMFHQWIGEVKKAIMTCTHLQEGHPDTKKSLLKFFEDDVMGDINTYIGHIVRKWCM
jgi:hypothetical protein